MNRPEHQVAALPFRVTSREKVKVILITSRGSGRWIPPKGWPMPHKTDWSAARLEALEEAGVSGVIGRCPLGRFDYRKSSNTVIHRVTLYPLRITRMHETWEEQDQRDRRWFTLRKAASAVEFPQLRDILRNLDAEQEGQAAVRQMMAHTAQ